MKRADTGTVSFTAISWGEDVLDVVGYEPVLCFSDVIREAEQEVKNISPSQAASLESQGQLSSEGKHPTGVSKGKAVNKVGRRIVVEKEKTAGSQQRATLGKISDVFQVTAGPVGEPTTVRVPPSRPTSQRR